MDKIAREWHFLNLIYDLSCTAIPWDNVDEEFLAVTPSVFATWGRSIPGSVTLGASQQVAHAPACGRSNRAFLFDEKIKI